MSVADFGEGSSLPNSCFAAKNDSPKWRVDDLFRIAHRGQIHTLIPTHEPIEISRDLIQLVSREAICAEERCKQFGDAGRVHHGESNGNCVARAIVMLTHGRIQYN